jgi:pimeloyl-[acyl-carrier protein] synthase
MTTETNLELDNFFATIQDPYPAYAYLREHEPVRWNPMFNCWMLVKYDDVHLAFQDHNRFSSDIWSPLPELLAEDAEIEAVRQIVPFMAYNLQGMDPPGHTRQRSLMAKTFTPRMLESFKPTVQKLVDDMIEAKLAEGKMDLVDDLAYPLPSNVILELLSIPKEGRPYIKASADAINEFVASLFFRTPGTWTRLAEVFQTVRAYLKGLIDERRLNPGEDLLSKMVIAEENGDVLSEDEIIIATNFLLFAGHETTANLIATGMMYLMQNPDQMAHLKANPDLMPQAVEELLRYVSPVHTLSRRAKEDMVIRGVPIQQGQSLFLLVGAANRDEEKFANAAQLDITRPISRTLGFGYGIHYCIGAALARLEAGIAFETILRRLPNIKMAVETPEFRMNYSLRGLLNFPITF